MPSWFDEFFFDLFVCWNHNYLGVALCCCWLFFAAFLFKTCLAFSRLISSSVMSSLMISWTKKSSSLSPREIKIRLWRFSLHKLTQDLLLQKKLNDAKYFSDIFHVVSSKIGYHFKGYSLLKQGCAWTSFEQNKVLQLTSADEGFVKVPYFDWTEDRANTFFKTNGL